MKIILNSDKLGAIDYVILACIKNGVKKYTSIFKNCKKTNAGKFVKKGILAKLDENFQASILTDKLEQPHSPYVHRNKIFVCSSAIAAVMSIEMEQKKSN